MGHYQLSFPSFLPDPRWSGLAVPQCLLSGKKHWACWMPVSGSLSPTAETVGAGKPSQCSTVSTWHRGNWSKWDCPLPFYTKTLFIFIAHNTIWNYIFILVYSVSLNKIYIPGKQGVHRVCLELYKNNLCFLLCEFSIYNLCPFFWSVQIYNVFPLLNLLE